MATSNKEAPLLSDPFIDGPDKTGCIPLPIHTTIQPKPSTTNSADSHGASVSAVQHHQNQFSSSVASQPGQMPDDGRRTSTGEALASPTKSWKPTFKRVQSWNREDFKRDAYKGEMEDGDQGQGTGFTEGGEGTRKV